MAHHSVKWQDVTSGLDYRREADEPQRVVIGSLNAADVHRSPGELQLILHAAP
jgi:hypothetical protein